MQAVRLEQAMVTGRRWPPPEFEALLVRHPLMTHLVAPAGLGRVRSARGCAKGLQGTFRVTEDLDLRRRGRRRPGPSPKGRRSGIVHPLHLPRPSGRRGASAGATTRSSRRSRSSGARLHRFEQATRPRARRSRASTEVEDPRRSSWSSRWRSSAGQRGFAEDGGVFDSHSKPFPGGGRDRRHRVQRASPRGLHRRLGGPERSSGAYFLPGVLDAGLRLGIRTPRLKEATARLASTPVVISEVLSDLSADRRPRARAG